MLLQASQAVAFIYVVRKYILVFQLTNVDVARISIAMNIMVYYSKFKRKTLQSCLNTVGGSVL